MRSCVWSFVPQTYLYRQQSGEVVCLQSKNSRKVQLTYLFMRVQKFWGDGKKCRINLFIEQRTAKHHNKHRVKTLKIQDISVGRDVKTFSEEKCPRGRQMPKQLWQRKKGGKYEWTEGTTIIYVNNVPLLLIISGKIKQKRKKKRGGGGGGGNITHVTQLIFLMQINNRNYKWKWCCCDRERKGETIERCPAFSLSPPLLFSSLCLEFISWWSKHRQM